MSQPLSWQLMRDAKVAAAVLAVLIPVCFRSISFARNVLSAPTGQASALMAKRSRYSRAASCRMVFAVTPLDVGAVQGFMICDELALNKKARMKNKIPVRIYNAWS